MATKTKTVVALAVSGALGLSACAGGGAGGGAAGGGGDGMIAQLTFPSDAPATMGGLVDYNPYAVNALTKTWLYEQLMVRNGISCEVTPWLATDYEWGGEASELTFTIRDGVKWSDGQPLTAKDVAFTYNLAKQYPAIDRAGIWKPVFGAPAKSITAEGNKVKIVFEGNAAPKFDELIRLQILPEHVYGKVGDPTKYIDKAPVGSGPFKVGSYNGRRLELVRRADYWQADKVKVQKLILEGNYDAAQASLKLRSGQLDAYWGEIPNPQRAFVDADKKTNHFWYAPNGSTVLSPNLEKAPFDDAKFREAIAPAINRQEISEKSTYGIMKPASQTGLKLPAAAKLLPEKYAANEGADTVVTFDAAKANQMLDAAGYTKGGDGKRRTKDGQPINLTFSVQAGFIDYQSAAEVIARNLNSVGVTTKVVATAPESVGRPEEVRRLPADPRVPARRLRERQEHRRQALVRPDPDQDRDPAQRRAVQGPGHGRDGQGAQRHRRRGEAEGARRQAGRHDDDAVPGHPADLRPRAHPLPHGQGRRLAQRGGPLRPARRRPAADPHPPEAGR